MHRVIFFFVLLVEMMPIAPSGQDAPAGVVSFPSSGKKEAQKSFLYGLAQLHNFEYAAAEAAFREAQEIDPDFAMAYWGEAMTHNHPVWMQQDRAAALAVLGRLGPTPAARLSKAPTEREKDYLASLEILYGEGSKYERDDAYREAMGRLHRKYPDDPEAAAFYALAILGSAHEGRDFATYMRAAAIAEDVFRDYPEHPGILHYLIHAYDDPIHAPLGLRAARIYAKIAPGAAHAQHMTSHIFVAMGMWDDVVAANENAANVANARRAARGQPPFHCGHYNFWLLYGLTQQGRYEDAARLLDGCREDMEKAGLESPVFDPDNSTLHSYLQLRTHYLFDTEAWDSDIARWSTTIPAEYVPERISFEYTQGFVAYGRGDLDELHHRLARLVEARGDLGPFNDENPDLELRTAGTTRSEIVEKQLRALVAKLEGNFADAVAILREAAGVERAMPFMFGPPYVDKPSQELLGEVLLDAGRPEEALEAFEIAASRTPDRAQVLEGLIASAEQSSNPAKASDARKRLMEMRKNADR